MNMEKLKFHMEKSAQKKEIVINGIKHNDFPSQIMKVLHGKWNHTIAKLHTTK